MTLPIHYRIACAHPGAHLFSITLTVAEPDPAGCVVSLPAWIPGSYMIREFARNIGRISARNGKRAITLVKINKHAWRAAPCAGPLVIDYEVYAWDLSVRAAHLDETHGFFNGTSVFLRVHGREQATHNVDIMRPAGRTYADWRVATSLPRARGTPAYGFGAYRAESYDALIDHPVEMGTFALVPFSACGVPHAVAITGRHDCDSARLAADLERICTEHIYLFHGVRATADSVPFASYLFLVLAVGDGYGGLEHRASTALICARNDLPYAGLKESSEGYRTFLGLCSHEYFHAWLVKRIQPLAFQPYQLDRKNFSTLLWFFEGFTSYYDDLLLLRSACISKEHYLNRLLRTVNQIQKNPGRHKQSVSDSSFDAWTKYYQMDANTPNAVVSYYAKGSLIAFALDLLIREATQHVKSLDDVMRLLWQRHGSFRHTPGLGLSEHDFENAVLTVTGVSFKDKWQNFALNYIKGTADIPVIELLASQGIRTTKKRLSITEQIVSQLGVRTANQDGWLKITQVLDHALAQQAGLAPDDVIVSLNQERVTPTNWLKLLEQFSTQPLKILAFRSDQLKTFYIPNRIKPITEYVLQVP